MNRTYKKLLAFLLTALMVLSLLPTAVFAQGLSRSSGGDNASRRMPTGYIPTQIHGTQAVTDAYLRGDMEEYYRLTGQTAMRDTLPSSWDSRDHGWVTSMKNQNPYGSCWAHAAMASIESYMIKFGIPVGTGSAATTSLNLSETQHCFFNYSSAYDAEGMLTGDKCTLTGGDNCLNSGGNGEMSAYTLQRWCGAADESQSALQYSRASTVGSSGLSSTYSYNYNVCHVQNSEWIPGTDIEAIKQAIMKYGAGNISYYESGSYTYTCTIDTTSQDSSSHKWANHAITVVGWDDSIAASNFKPNKPSSPGAWLCKNSWGTSYFNQGYMYISYEDTTVLEGSIFFYDAEPIDNYAHNYQYDGSCNVVCYGKGWPSSADYYVGFANNTKVANVFTAKGNESLKAVAFCSWDEALTYTAQVYKNPTAGNPSSGTLMATETGTMAFPGYYTIPLSTPVSLAAGDTFAVVITQNVAVADDDGNYVHTPYDATFNNTDVVSWANWTHANHGNTSYYQEPNGAWTDCPDNGDYRIKAYTDDVTFTLTAVSNNTSYGTVAVSDNVITATPAAGYYVESCDVISGTATCTISGNTITVAASADCTVRVNFAPKPTYTVNFVACGNAEGSQSALVNDAITLPSSVSVNPDGWTFAGWMTQQIDETADKPTYYAPGASYTVTGNTTLYALYTREEEGTGDLYYELLSAAPDNWAGNYVITYGTDSSLYVMKGVTVSSNGSDIESSSNAASLSASGMTLDGTKLSNVSNTYLFNVAASGSYYTIRNASTKVYVGETSSNYLGGYNTYSSGYCDWTLGTMTNASSATCVNGGSYPYLSYNPSGNYFWTQGSNGVSNGYVYNVRWWKEATGNTTYYWTDPEVAPAHEHSMTHVAAVAATCTEAGNSEYWYCSDCGKYFSDAEGNNEITLESTVIAALGHSWGDWTVTTPATCAADGAETRTCSRCGETETRPIPATGEHSYGEYVSNNDGTHKHVCSVCGDTVTESCTYSDVVTQPTATEGGYTTHTCTVCGYSFVDSYTDPLGNDYLVTFSVPTGVTAPAAMTCHENGTITLPTAAAPAGYTFLGWVTDDYNNVDTLPGTVLTGTYAATASITLKALYTRTVTTGAGYELVTAAPADWAGQYVITHGKTAADMTVLKGLTGTKKYESKTAGGAVAYADAGMTLEGNVLTGVNDAFIFNVTAADGKFAVQNAATGTYLASKGGYLYSYKTNTASYCRWALAVAGGAVDATNAASRTNTHLSFNANGYFNIARKANTDICFWKLGDGSTSTIYTTVIG